MATEKAVKRYLLPDGKEARSASEDAVALLFKFANDESRTLELSMFPDNIRNIFAFHGMSQKCGDAYAGAESVEQAVELFDAKVEALAEGRWIERAEGVVRSSDLAQAMVDLAPAKYPDLAAAGAAIKAMTDEERKARENIPQVKARIEELRFERAQAKVLKAKEAASKAGADALSGL